MKKNITHFISFCLLVVALPTLLSAQKGLTTNHEAIYHKIVKEYTLNTDGSSSMRFYKKLTLNTFNAMNKIYGETFILYNPAYQTLTINLCQTILPNGNVVVNTENAFNEVLPQFCDKAPAYNHLKEMVVTHIGLELGATIELDYTIETSAGLTTFFSDRVIFGEEVPVEEYEVIVHLPEGTNMGHGMNIAICDEPMAETADGVDTYRWKATQLPPIVFDLAAPALAETTPMLLFTTARDFQRVFFDLVRQDAFQKMSVPSAKSVIRKIQEENNLEMAQIAAIQRFVMENIKLVDIPDRLIGYRYADPETIWQRKYATKAEKAILMAAMMHDAGIRAMPARVCDKTLYDVKIAAHEIFDQWVVKIISDQKPFYISINHADANNLKFYYLARKIVWGLDANAESLRSDLFEIQQPAAQLSGTLQITPDLHLTGTMSLRTESEFQPFFAISADENAAKKQVTALSKNAITKIKETKMSESDGEYVLSIDDASALTQKGDYYFWRIPSVKSIDRAFDLGALPTHRQTAIVLHPLRYDTHIQLVIPEDLELVSLPISQYSRKSFGNYQIDIQQNEQTIIISRVLEISDTESILQPLHYDIFRQFYNEWNNEAWQQLIFRKKK